MPCRTPFARDDDIRRAGPGEGGVVTRAGAFYHYDLAGNRIRAQYSTGRVVETSYDGLNRPEIIAEGGRVTQYGYDLGGRAVILIAANGQTSQNSHDALGRLKDRTLFKTSAMQESEVLAQFEWEHDILGNVLAQHETWPGEVTRPQNIRSTVMAYDDNNRLLSETIQTRSNGAAPPVDQSSTSYTYDNANNRASKTVTRIAASSTEAGENDVGHWAYTYNSANQLTGWEKSDYPSGTPQKTATLTYDAAGNRIAQTIQDQASGIQTTSYAWDAQDRLASVTMPDGSEHAYAYDYRTRRIGTTEGTVPGLPTKTTAIVFSGGLSLAEYESETGSLPVTPTVEYTRGPDMGGGVGGMLYSIRSSSIQNQASSIKYSLSNGRGDIVAQADQSAALTWTASYEAYGKRTKETGTNQDKQRANSKDEDPTGLLNEGFRYRDIETGVWLSRDPAGFVDGPNLYAYVQQNPWTGFDPEGLTNANNFAVYGGVIGGGVMTVGSLYIDAVTGGVNILATPMEVACATAIGSGIGYGVGWVCDRGSDLCDSISNAFSGSEPRGPTEHITTPATKPAQEPSIVPTAPKPNALPGSNANPEAKPNALLGPETNTDPQPISTPGQQSAQDVKNQNELHSRGTNHLKPDANAQGSHTTFKRDANGNITGYAEWVPNPQNPNGFDQVKRVDTQHAAPTSHVNKVTGQDVPVPHVHEKQTPGGVRPAKPEELPK